MYEEQNAMWAYMGRWAASNGVDLRTKEGLRQAEIAWDRWVDSQCDTSDTTEQEQPVVPIDLGPVDNLVVSCVVCGEYIPSPSDQMCEFCSLTDSMNSMSN